MLLWFPRKGTGAPYARMFFSPLAKKTGCPIQARFWLVWDTTVLNLKSLPLINHQGSESRYPIQAKTGLDPDFLYAAPSNGRV